MASSTIVDPLIATKLHRPIVDRNHVHRPGLLERLDQRRQRPLTLVAAPAGYGKTALVSSWLEASSIPSAWVSLDEGDNDLHLFLSYFLTAIQTMFSDACRKTLEMVNAVSLPPVSALAGNLINELDRIEQPFILVLDDFHLIKNESVFDLINALLRHPPQAMHLVLIGRRDPPLPISSLRAKSLVLEIRTQNLRFNEMETATFLTRVLGTQIESTTAAALEEKTEGWVTGLRLAALSMRHRVDLDPKLLEPHVDAQYVLEYLFNEVFSHQPSEISRYLLGTAVLDRFCGPLCEAVCAPGAEPFTCEIGGWEFIAWLKKENIFLIPLDPEKRWFRFHHLFRKLLLNQLNRQYGAEDIKALHIQASVWFTENGLIEEALQHVLTAGDIPAATQLVERYGYQLMNDQQWPRLTHWLNLLPRDQVEQNPELLLLEAWLYQIRHDLFNQWRCLEMVEAMDASTAPDTLSETLISAKHVQGQLEAMRGMKHYIAADAEIALRHLRLACEIIPPHYKRARVFAHIYQLGAYQMIGELATGLPVYQEEMRDCISKDPSYHSAYLTNLCHIYWMDADLIAMCQTAESALIAEGSCQLPDTAPYVLYFQGVFHYHRNELKIAEEKLTQVVEDYRFTSPVNYAHSAFALAFTLQAQKKFAEARETGGALINHAVETNNADLLLVARAFEAELALRQGRLAEAFQWAKGYQAKPFRPTYRFYMPQVTLIRILLAQGTTDSLQQAADLLDQLHDFLVSIHNHRFQIDVLVLKALLCSSQKDDPAALKTLTEALNLAEPGGFIRLFVDLGHQMADLLKQLIEQNVAVDYIGRILAAFKEDEHRTMPGESDLPTAHPPPLSTQPLVEALTNRELQILDLLAQRLRNKEIAEKLFISPETVKKHLNNIYGKLNASGRRQAVEKAMHLGILTRL